MLSTPVRAIHRYDGYVPSPVGTPGVTAGPKIAGFEPQKIAMMFTRAELMRQIAAIIAPDR